MDENLYVCLRFGGAVCVYVCVYVCAVLYDYEHAQVHSSLRIHMYMGACFLAAGVNNRSSTCARTHTGREAAGIRGGTSSCTQQGAFHARGAARQLNISVPRRVTTLASFASFLVWYAYRQRRGREGDVKGLWRSIQLLA